MCDNIFPVIRFRRPPPTKGSGTVKAGVGTEFDIPTPSAKPQGPQKPDRGDVLERQRLEAANERQKLKSTSGRGKVITGDKLTNAIKAELAEEEALLKKLEGLTKEDIAKDLKDNTDRINRNLLDDRKKISYDKRIKLLQQRDLLKKTHENSKLFAKLKIKRLKDTLTKLAKSKAMLPCILGIAIGIDTSPEAIAGTVIRSIFDLNVILDRLIEESDRLEKLLEKIDLLEQEYQEKTDEIEDIRAYLNAFGFKTQEEFKKNKDAVTALQRMGRLEKEREELRKLINLREGVENDQKKNDQEIKDVMERIEKIPEIF